MDLPDIVQGILFQIKTAGEKGLGNLADAIGAIKDAVSGADPATEKLGTSTATAGAKADQSSKQYQELSAQIAAYGDAAAAVARQIEQRGAATAASMAHVETAQARVNASMVAMEITGAELGALETSIALQANKVAESMVGQSAAHLAATEAIRRQVAAEAGLTDSNSGLASSNSGLASSNSGLASSGINVESMMIRMVLRMAIMYVTIRPILSIIQELVKQHEEWDTAMKRSTFLLTQQGQSAQVTSGQLKQQLESLSRVGQYNQGDVAKSFADLDQATRNSASALKLVQDAENLSAASGEKLETVTKAVASAVEGNIGALDKMGVHFDAQQKAVLKVASEEERAAIIHDALFRKFGGAMEDGASVLRFWEKLTGYIKFFVDAFPKDQLPIALGGTPPAFHEDVTPGKERADVVNDKALKDAAAKRAAQDAGVISAEKYAEAQLKVAQAELQLDSISKQSADQIRNMSEAFKVEPINKYLAAQQKIQEQLEKQQALTRETAAADLDRAHILELEANVAEKAAAVDRQKIASSIASKTNTAESVALLQADINLKQAEAQSDRAQAAALDVAAGKIAYYGSVIAPALATTKSFAEAQKQATDEANELSKGIEKTTEGFASVIDKARQAALQMPAAFGDPLLKQLDGFDSQFDDALNKVINKTWSLDQFADFVKGLEDAIKSAQGTANGLMIEAAKTLEKEVQGVFSDLTSDFDALLAAGANGNLKGVLDTIFKQTTKDFGKYLTEAIAGGPAPTKREGESEESFRQRQQQFLSGPAGVLDHIFQTVGAAYGAYQGFQQLSQPGTTIGAGLLTGASLGAALGTAIGGAIAGSIVPGIGTIIGAVVGAVAGVITAAVGPSKGSTYQYGIPYGNYGANVYELRFPQNLDPQAVAKYVQQFKETVDSMVGGLIDVLAKMPGDLLSQMQPILDTLKFQGLNAANGGSIYGTIGGGASENWAKHLGEFFSDGITTEILDVFKPVLLQGLENLGLTSAAANYYLDQVSRMDPSKATSFFLALVTGLSELQQVQQSLNAEANPLDVANFSKSIWGMASEQMNATFMDTLQPMMDQFKTLTQEIPLLQGQQQADAIKQAGDLAIQIRQQEIQDLQKIMQLQQQVDTTIDASIRSLTLAGMTKNGKPDYAAQENYLNAYYQSQLGRLAGAKTVDQATLYEGNAYNTLMQMYQLAQQSGNTQAAEQYRQWAIAQLQQLENQYNGVTNAMAKPLEDLNVNLANLIAALEDFINSQKTFGPGTDHGPGGPGDGPGKTPRGNQGTVPDTSRTVPGAPTPGVTYRYSTGPTPVTVADGPSGRQADVTNEVLIQMRDILFTMASRSGDTTSSAIAPRAAVARSTR